MPTDDAPLRDDELLIVRTFDAPLALVWRIWEDVDHMRGWWGPEGFTVLSLHSDFRPGGRWRANMTSPVWGENWSGGRYTAIERHQRIVFTFAWEEGSGSTNEMLTTVTFEEHDGRTTQRFHQAPFLDVETRDGHTVGWGTHLAREQAYAEKLARSAAG